MVYIVNLLGGLILLFLGLITRFLKASWLVAGYNTASKEEKAKYDEEKLTRYVGNLLIILSIVLLLGGLLMAIFISQEFMILSISWVLFFILSIVGLIYVNTGNKIKKV